MSQVDKNLESAMERIIHLIDQSCEVRTLLLNVPSAQEAKRTISDRVHNGGRPLSPVAFGVVDRMKPPPKGRKRSIWIPPDADLRKNFILSQNLMDGHRIFSRGVDYGVVEYIGMVMYGKFQGSTENLGGMPFVVPEWDEAMVLGMDIYARVKRIGVVSKGRYLHAARDSFKEKGRDHLSKCAHDAPLPTLIPVDGERNPIDLLAEEFLLYHVRSGVLRSNTERYDGGKLRVKFEPRTTFDDIAQSVTPRPRPLPASSSYAHTPGRFLAH